MTAVGLATGGFGSSARTCTPARSRTMPAIINRMLNSPSGSTRQPREALPRGCRHDTYHSRSGPSLPGRFAPRGQAVGRQAELLALVEEEVDRPGLAVDPRCPEETEAHLVGGLLALADGLRRPVRVVRVT